MWALPHGDIEQATRLFGSIALLNWIYGEAEVASYGDDRSW